MPNNEHYDMPVDKFAIVHWGGGNYYLEDRELGKTVRITPDTYWKILLFVNEFMKNIELNGGGENGSV